MESPLASPPLVPPASLEDFETPPSSPCYSSDGSGIPSPSLPSQPHGYEVVLHFMRARPCDALHSGAPGWVTRSIGFFATLERAIEVGNAATHNAYNQTVADRFHVVAPPSRPEAGTGPIVYPQLTGELVLRYHGPPDLSVPRFCGCCNALTLIPVSRNCATCGVPATAGPIPTLSMSCHLGVGLCDNCCKHVYTAANSRVPFLLVCCHCALAANSQGVSTLSPLTSACMTRKRARQVLA